MEINIISVFFQGKTERCLNLRSRYRYSYLYDDLDRFSRYGCRRVCSFPGWVQKCCKNHFGRDCQGKKGRDGGTYVRNCAFVCTEVFLVFAACLKTELQILKVTGFSLEVVEFV